MDFSARLGVAAFAGCAFYGFEAAKTGKDNGIAAFQGFDDVGKQCFICGFSLASVASLASSFNFLMSSALFISEVRFILDGGGRVNAQNEQRQLI